MQKAMHAETLMAVEAALEVILGAITPVRVEQVPLPNSAGRVLAQSMVAGVNVPPFANSAMDGYAVVGADIAAAAPENPVLLQVVANIPAGTASDVSLSPGTAARIMTGAPMPAGADTVVRFEETSEYMPTENLGADEVAIYQPVSTGANVRPIGEDIREGSVILEAGHRLRSQDVGVLAAVGQAQVPVYRRPRVAILATGDELVAVDEAVGPGQIRNANEYVQAAMVQKYGGEPVMLGIARDTIDDLTAKIEQGLAHNVDLFITSAGVSVGDFDVVKNVLNAKGEMQFWQVAIKPGKPLSFGLLDGGVPLIGLPGNPVAAMVAFEVFARPALLKLGGQTAWNRTNIQAVLEEEIINSGRRHYMRGYLRQGPDGYRVTTRGSGVQVQGSGILSSMVWANCLVVVPEQITSLPAGASVEVWVLD